MGRDTTAFLSHDQNGLAEFPIPLTLPHNIAAAAAHSSEFWGQNFPLHPTFNPALLHQNILPSYKMPNIHAFLTQYMGLNNLGIFSYPHNLGVGPRISPTMMSNSTSSKESPSSHDVDKWIVFNIDEQLDKYFGCNSMNLDDNVHIHACDLGEHCGGVDL